MSKILPTTQPQNPPRSYHQLPGEPDRWYERFRAFCHLGTSRSLRKCYRQLMAGPDNMISGKQVPGAWKRRAEEFDWAARAAAWDADRRQRSLKRHEDIIEDIIESTRESLRYHINLMRGRVVEPDGTITIIRDPYERRMAAKTLFSKGVEVLFLLQDVQGQAGEEVKITEIRARLSGSGSQEKK